jgi:tetratricopeptide (TPR) repeat protein
MTEISQNNPSDSTAPYEIAALEAQLTSNPMDPRFYVHLAMAYLKAGQFDDGIQKFIQCYKINIKNKRNQPQNRIKFTESAAKTAGTIGHHWLNRSRDTLNTSLEQRKKAWLKGIEWKKKEYRLISTLINSDPSKKYDLARIADEVGQEYLKASKRLREANTEQADEYWLKGMKWKKKSWHFDEELSWTGQRTIKHTIENCALTADEIGQEYLDASHRLRGANPEQAEKYWLKGMVWKEKAYGSYKELSHTDPSKKQDCAKTAVQIAREFAAQGIMDYYAIEWCEKALEHDPECTHIKKDGYETLILAEQLEIVQTLGRRTRL